MFWFRPPFVTEAGISQAPNGAPFVTLLPALTPVQAAEHQMNAVFKTASDAFIYS